MTYTNTKDAAANLRAALKAKWNARQVSVRTDYYSMGSSLDVTIRDAKVPLAVVKALASEAERIRYCEFSGEILSGGNRYVHVEYTPEALAALAAPYLPGLTTTAARLAPLSEGTGLDIDGAPGFVLFKGRNGYGFVAYHGSDRLMEYGDLDGVAYSIAIRSQVKA